MSPSARLKLISDHPIGNGLDAFHASFDSICNSTGIRSADEIDGLGREGVGTVRNELLRLVSTVASDDFDFDRVKPLLKAALADNHEDALIWDLVSAAAVESTPPPRPIPPSIKQTPLSQNTSGLVNSSEFRHNVDPILKLELEHLYVGLPNFHKAFFGDVPALDMVSEAVFRQCSEGDTPLFREGWSGWPAAAKEGEVLAWFGDLIPKLEAFAGDHILHPAARRKLLAQPRSPLAGSTGKRSMDIGFVSHDITSKPESADSTYNWSHVLVVGELKSNPKADTASIAWTDLARYAREVFAAQDTRRFVLGFTLCGSLMRVWEFDRLGGIASERFDINKEDGGVQFVTTILGFLRMNREMLGFDPTIIAIGDQQHLEIKRNNETELLIIDEVMKRARCIAGRATVCRKAHRKDDPQTPLVIKDSWQYTDREEEGELLREVTGKGVANVARYYHHQTVCVRDADDDIQQNIRKGLDVTTATKYRLGRGILPSSASATWVSRQGRSASASRKRPSSETDATIPPSKRPFSRSPTKASVPLPNRVHRRVILRDYGEPIYKASSPVALLAALECCIEGHRSLYMAGFLHRDISVNNLMINEDVGNPSRRAFLIDLDLAIKAQREGASGAQGKTGTRAFMAIGALLGQDHSFMHDLESFFWVLFWICIHYDGPGSEVGPTEFESWNYESDSKLVGSKKGVISDEEDFLNSATVNFTPHYKPLIPCVNRLRRKVFPNGERWKKPELGLYELMTDILRQAQKDIETASV
ncbi:Sulfatase domain containing protein [Purpureocillium lavendulum]|uniref:non-specific serine/threonine protein kinase n=1 Tax=Purpureocillium lavendulum TaxID=1247861 RepID=A0AB34FCP2_9HYPO|nr:Sulfatase domain containing protein [Purpureocillium lavendulum]